MKKRKTTKRAFKFKLSWNSPHCTASGIVDACKTIAVNESDSKQLKDAQDRLGEKEEDYD